MFDNNQNFNNNPKPLFDTNFNNQSFNNESSTNVQNNYGNIDFQNGFNNNQMFNNFNFQNNSSNNFGNNMTVNNPLENSFLQGDIPPELGEIKNLSEATTASAPTMDVLGPMNTMPENSNLNNDPIMAYENGNINLLQSNDVSQNLNPSFDIGLSTQSTSNLNMDNSSVSLPFEFNLNNTQGNTLSNNSSETNYNGDNGVSNLASSNINNESLRDIPNFNYGMLNNFSEPIKNDFSSESNSFNLMNQTLPSFDNFDVANVTSSENNFDLENKTLESKNENISPVDSSIETQNENIDYTIIQDKEIEKSKEEVQNLSNLGIEDSYDEEDTLDIMDFEEDNDEESATGDASNEEKPLLIENVEKIKKVIEELKQSGVDIEFEEFDFEHMYQLIVKINK